MDTKITTLGELCEIRGRVGWKGYSVEDLRSSGPLVLGANDITADNFLSFAAVKHLSREKYEESPEIFVQKNDILVVKIGSTIGKVAIVTDEIGEATINPNCMIVRPVKVDPYLLYVYLCSKPAQDYILRYSQKSGQSALGQEDIKKLPILFDANASPNVEIIQQINNKIFNNNAICADLEGMAKLLYDYWFVQFDFPDENGKPYKSSGGKMVWNEELKREIPEGWEAVSLSDCLMCNKNSLGSNDHYEYIEYLDTSSLTENVVSSLQHITDPDEFPVRAKRIIHHNDILYSTVRPEQKHFGIIKNPPEKLIASTGFAVLSCKKGAEFNDLFYLFLSSDSTTHVLNTIANSSVSAYPSIVPGDILNLKMCLPKNLGEVGFALNKIQTAHTAIDELHKENADLASLRDFLLPMLMNGQVKVKETIA